MTRLEALEQCLDAVLSGTEERIIHRGAFSLDEAVNVDLAYAGSLDAAKALHDAVLPGWSVNSIHQERQPNNGMPPTGKWTCLLFRYCPTIAHVETKTDNPARAWLLAIIKALIAEERDK